MVKPFLKRLCIALWALWGFMTVALALAAPFVGFSGIGKGVAFWLGFTAATAFLLVLLQYLLTGLWRPADLLK